MAGPLSHQELRRRLSLMRVAKDVFLSEWYQAAADALISPEGRAALRRVSAESMAEREAVLDVIEEWAERDQHDAHEAHGMRAMQATMARDFLDSMIGIKEASAEVLQKAAIIAPPDIAERLLPLAKLDLAHAMALRQLVLDEFPNPADLMVPPAGAPIGLLEEQLPPEYRR